MPRGDSQAHSPTQKRQAEHLAAGYAERGVPPQRREAIAWATVNKQDNEASADQGGTKRASPAPKKRPAPKRPPATQAKAKPASTRGSGRASPRAP